MNVRPDILQQQEGMLKVGFLDKRKEVKNESRTKIIRPAGIRSAGFEFYEISL